MYRPCQRTRDIIVDEGDNCAETLKRLRKMESQGWTETKQTIVLLKTTRIPDDTGGIIMSLHGKALFVTGVKIQWLQ